MYLFCISICSAGLPARCSACLATHLAMHLAIWLLVCQSGGLLGCSSIHLAAPGSESGRISVWSTIYLLFCLFCRLLILLLILVFILLVCQFGHLQVCSVACRLQFRPFACSTGQVSIRLFICQSGNQGFIHLPDPQAKSRSVSSSANLAGRAPICRIFCSISCNWQHVCLPAGSSSAGRGPIRSSIFLGHCHFRRLNRFQHICVIANLLSRPRATSGQSTHTYSSPGINLRHQAVSSPYMLASQALQIPHICFIASPSSGTS